MADNEKTLDRGQAGLRARDTTPDELTVEATDGTASTTSRAFLRISAACPTQEYRDPEPGGEVDTQDSRQFFADRDSEDTVDVDFADYSPALVISSPLNAVSGYEVIVQPAGVDPDLWLTPNVGISGTDNEVDTWESKSTSGLTFVESGSGKPLLIQGVVDMNNATAQENYFLCGDVNTFKDITETGVFSLGWRGTFATYDTPVFTVDASLLHTRGSTGRGTNLFISGGGSTLSLVTWNGVGTITHRCDWGGWGAYYTFGTFVDIIIIGDGVDMKMYVDGVEVGNTGTIATDAGPHALPANFGKLNNGSLYHIGVLEGVWYDNTSDYGFADVEQIREFLLTPKSILEDFKVFASGDVVFQANSESDADGTSLRVLPNRALGLTSFLGIQENPSNQATLETEFLPFGNNVYEFDGGDFYRVLNSDIAPVIPRDSNFTLEAVLRLTTTVGTQAIFAQYVDSPGNGSFLLSYQGGFRVDLISDGTAPDEVLTTPAATAGTTYHVVVIREGNTFSLYLDGVLEDTVTDVSTRQIAQVGSLLGANDTSGGVYDGLAGNFFEGQIAELSLTAFEVEKIEALSFGFNSVYGDSIEVRILDDPFIVNFIDVRLAPWVTTSSNMTVVGELTGRSTPFQLSTSTFYRPTFTEGVLNGFPMMTFDGSGDYFEWSGIADAIGANRGEFTVTSLIQPTETSGVGYINSFNTSSGGNTLLVGYNGTTDRFVLFDGVGGLSYESTNTFAPGNFYVVTARQNGELFELYVDGVLEMSQTVDAVVNSTDRYLLCAELDSSTPSDYFQGLVGFHAVAASAKPFYQTYFESYVYGTYFNPEDLPDAFAVFEADTPGAVYADTDPVTSWGDLTVNANDADQAVGVEQPTYVGDSLNGLPGISFDGGDSLIIPSVISNGVGDELTVVTFASNTSGGQGTLVTTEENLNEGFTLGYDGSNDLLYEHANQTPILTETFGKTSPEVVSAKRVGSDADVDINAKYQGDTTLTGFTPATDLNTRIGNSTQQPGFNGTLYEMALYSRALRDSEARGIAYGYGVKYGSFLTAKPAVTNEVFEFDILQEVGYVEGDPVPTLTDQSGTADATQGTLSLQGEYRASLIAGLPTLYFDGSTFYTSPTVPALGADPRTIFMVGTPYKEGPSDGVVFGYGPDTGGEDFVFFLQNSTSGFTDVWQFSNNVIITDVFSPTWGLEVIAITYDGTTLRIYQNGSLKVQAEATLNTASQGITVGDQDLGANTSNRYQGWLSYLQFRNDALTEQEVRTYTNYLARKFRLPY